MPLSALFILFDFVVHNPFHPETNTNLALLDVAAGYFSRLEYATGGSLPASLLSDFAHIARQFVRDVQSGQRVPTEPAPVNMQNDNIKSLDGIPDASQEVACFPAQFGVSPAVLSGTTGMLTKRLPATSTDEYGGADSDRGSTSVHRPVILSHDRLAALCRWRYRHGV